MTEYSLNNLLKFAENFKNKRLPEQTDSLGYSNYNPRLLYIIMRKQDVKNIKVYRNLRSQVKQAVIATMN